MECKCECKLTGITMVHSRTRTTPQKMAAIVHRSMPVIRSLMSEAKADKRPLLRTCMCTQPERCLLLTIPGQCVSVACSVYLVQYGARALLQACSTGLSWRLHTHRAECNRPKHLPTYVAHYHVAHHHEQALKFTGA